MTDNTELMPPSSQSAEEGLVGSIIIDPKCLWDVMGFIEPTDFYYGVPRSVYGAIVELATNKIPIDMLTIYENLSKQTKNNITKGDITKMIVNTPSSLNAMAYAKIIEDCSMRRKVVTECSKAVNAAYNQAKPFDPGDYMEEIFKTKKTHGRRTIKENLSAFWDWAQSKLERPGQLSGYSTGIPGLDKMLDGLDRKSVV
jgi:replicative DNA helicase